MKILVTGGAGYIGSILVPKLLNLNYDVTVIDNFKYKVPSLAGFCTYSNLNIINGDVRNNELMTKVLHKYDLIIPLAALVGMPICKKEHNEATDVNENSIKYLVQNLDKNQRIIIPTTNSGYGIGESGKYCNEESPINPISLYGKTKMNAEKFVMDHENSISLRLATVFGMSPRMRLDLLVNDFVYRSF